VTASANTFNREKTRGRGKEILYFPSAAVATLTQPIIQQEGDSRGAVDSE